MCYPHVTRKLAGRMKLVRTPGAVVTRAGGFTLVELMIGLVVMAVLLQISIPVYRDFIVGQQLRAVTTNLRIAMMTARSEAIKRNRNVAVKPGPDGWSSGWTIASPNPGEPAILNHGVSSNATITTTATEAKFLANGRVKAVEDFQINVGTGTYLAVGCLSLQLSGRADYGDSGCPLP